MFRPPSGALNSRATLLRVIPVVVPKLQVSKPSRMGQGFLLLFHCVFGLHNISHHYCHLFATGRLRELGGGNRHLCTSYLHRNCVISGALQGCRMERRAECRNSTCRACGNLVAQRHHWARVATSAAVADLCLACFIAAAWRCPLVRVAHRRGAPVNKKRRKTTCLMAPNAS